MANDKTRAEGVALSLDDTPDRYEAGVPVAAPTEDVPEPSGSESKSGQKAASLEGK